MLLRCFLKTYFRRRCLETSLFASDNGDYFYTVRNTWEQDREESEVCYCKGERVWRPILRFSLGRISRSNSFFKCLVVTIRTLRMSVRREATDQLEIRNRSRERAARKAEIFWERCCVQYCSAGSTVFDNMLRTLIVLQIVLKTCAIYVINLVTKYHLQNNIPQSLCYWAVTVGRG